MSCTLVLSTYKHNRTRAEKFYDHCNNLQTFFLIKLDIYPITTDISFNQFANQKIKFNSVARLNQIDRLAMNAKSEIEFCDSKVTWQSGVYDFTSCVEQTVLVWLPCAFLWIFFVVDVHFARASRYKDIPWNAFNITKFFILGILICLTLADLIVLVVFKDLFVVDILNPMLKMVTFVCMFDS